MAEWQPRQAAAGRAPAGFKGLESNVIWARPISRHPSRNFFQETERIPEIPCFPEPP